MHRIAALSRFSFLCALLGCGIPSIDVQDSKAPAGTASTFEAAFDELVTDKNDFLSREIQGPEVNRNEALAKDVRYQFEQYVKAPHIQRAFHEVSADYAQVLGDVRTQGLPDVLAAIPFHESRYQADAQSNVCAKGHWQFIPETAVRAGLAVKDCQMSKSTESWTPTADATRSTMESRPYVETAGRGEHTCLIASCTTDERTDLAASTTAVLPMMANVYKMESVIKSGKAVELTILSHWVGAERVQSFLRARKGGTASGSRSESPRHTAPETDAPRVKRLPPHRLLGRGYEAKVIAFHLIARCVYGAHFGDAHDAFKGFQMNFAGSYCEQWKFSKPADAAEDEIPAE